jgi:hypothetical protein
MIDRSKKLQARFYLSSLGSNPVRNWLLQMPANDRHIIGKDIQKVEFSSTALCAAWVGIVGGA